MCALKDMRAVVTRWCYFDFSAILCAHSFQHGFSDEKGYGVWSRRLPASHRVRLSEMEMENDRYFRRSFGLSWTAFSDNAYTTRVDASLSAVASVVLGNINWSLCISFRSFLFLFRISRISKRHISFQWKHNKLNAFFYHFSTSGFSINFHRCAPNFVRMEACKLKTNKVTRDFNDCGKFMAFQRSRKVTKKVVRMFILSRCLLQNFMCSTLALKQISTIRWPRFFWLLIKRNPCKHECIFYFINSS